LNLDKYAPDLTARFAQQAQLAPKMRFLWKAARVAAFRFDEAEYAG
jgi:hypothetical protein